ncbi:FkbM family methyltransferase [Seonamhaeicola maritimus]|uniref:FkbM family methyltransferase n=1 Tax=Seonamhaeicola maritimus TaxID=2591822 RepID=A0A5C7GK79_9FLAO|nr:FkbM family methyltransferase [Seonamhaeicola maritimus]TXG38876.1 FkbM family methyltransferase [Seonamhaeicola maritimus]
MSILIKFYNFFPKSTKTKLRQFGLTSRIIDWFIKDKNAFRVVKTLVSRRYLEREIQFLFFASIKDAAKAKTHGFETKLLQNSMRLCAKIKKEETSLFILDIGANFGFLSLVWANSLTVNEGAIFAFEPNKNVFKAFAKSISKNHLETMITLENCAVGSEKKIVKLNLNNTTSNVLDIKASNKSEYVQMTSVDTYLFDNAIQKCDLIKIDVDGIELDILKGCSKTLLKYRPIFIVETNENKDIIEFFKSRNYKVLDMDLNEYIVGEFMPPNIFCIPN